MSYSFLYWSVKLCRCCISNTLPNTEERPNAYASRRFTLCDKNQKWSIRSHVQFHQFLYWRRFTPMTVYKPLTTVLNPQKIFLHLLLLKCRHWQLYICLSSSYCIQIHNRTCECRWTLKIANTKYHKKIRVIEKPEIPLSSFSTRSKFCLLAVETSDTVRSGAEVGWLTFHRHSFEVAGISSLANRLV